MRLPHLHVALCGVCPEECHKVPAANPGAAMKVSTAAALVVGTHMQESDSFKVDFRLNIPQTLLFFMNIFILFF